MKVDAAAGRVAVLFDYATHSTALGPKNYQISGDVHGLAEQFVERHLGDRVIASAFAGASGDIDPWYRVLPAFETDNGWIPEPVLLGTLLGEEVVHTLRRIEVRPVRGPVRSVYTTLQLPSKPHDESDRAGETPPTPLNVTVARMGEGRTKHGAGEMRVSCRTLASVGSASLGRVSPRRPAPRQTLREGRLGVRSRESAAEEGPGHECR